MGSLLGPSPGKELLNFPNDSGISYQRALQMSQMNSNTQTFVLQLNALSELQVASAIIIDGNDEL